MAAKPLTKAVALAFCIGLGAAMAAPVLAQDDRVGVSIRPVPRPSARAPGLGPSDAGAVQVTAGQMMLAPPLAPDAPTPPLAEDAAPASAAIVADSRLAPSASLRPVARDTWLVPAARWDDHPRGARWTAAVMAALRGPGAPLLDVVPRDIAAWCPGYPSADRSQRAAFWTGLISTLAWHESTHDPRAVGGGGRWFGLVQIAPGTARWRDCDVQNAEALLNGAANLRCGIRIMGITVPRDRVVSEGMRGVAADWGPFHSSRKREAMRRWVRAQDYCRSPTRPQMRPANPSGAEPRLGPAEAGEIAASRPVLRP